MRITSMNARDAACRTVVRTIVAAWAFSENTLEAVKGGEMGFDYIG